MSSAVYLNSVLNRRNIDVCGIAEHWLYEKDLHFLDSVNKDYTSYAVSDNDLVLPLFRKRAKGGVALLWKHSLDSRVAHMDIIDDRIIGIRLTIAKYEYMFILQVYLPTTSQPIEFYREYMLKLADLHSIYSPQGRVVIMGDFNAELYHMPVGRSKNFFDLLTTCQLFSANTRPYCNGPKATCTSYATGARSLIDHVLYPVSSEDTVCHCEIADDVAINVSNHQPVWLQLSLPIDPCNTLPSNTTMVKTCYNWAKADVMALSRYCDGVTQLCTNSVIIDNTCSDKQDIDDLYECICTGLKDASDCVIPVKGFRPYLKPYWNDVLKQLHKIMAACRYRWISDGRPRDRQSVTFSVYKDAKRQFRCEHRKAANRYIDDLQREVDRCAEVDHRSFYKLVNTKRKKSTARAGCEIQFGNETCRDPLDIADKWGDHFQSLYSHKTLPDFNEDHYRQICTQLSSIIDRNTAVAHTSSVQPISSGEVESACRQLSTGKAGSYDSLTNEHLKYGGSALHETLSYLYNAIMRHGYIPMRAKQGIIITLYKGGGKRKDSPNSYRAITLLPAVTKLLERILLQRFQDIVGDRLPHALQNGFLPHMNSTMTSFVVTECIKYAQERGNKLYAAFLDAEKAFDNVWIDGLLWKLDKVGIQGEYWNVVRSLYTNMSSCVLHSGHTSRWFPILQGTRQGGVLSPWLFLLFIDDLLKSLCNITFGLSVREVACYAPTQADDITILALSKANLEAMLDCCYTYACDWRFNFNVNKSVVIVFNESASNHKPTRSWCIGGHPIKEVDVVVHLGSTLTKDLRQTVNINNACQKARGSFLGLINCGLHAGGFHPLTSLKIYNSVVLPSALYGSELWCDLTKSSILSLERVQHFCLKVLQGLPKRTRSDIVTGLLGVRSLESSIHQRKLVFLGALCNLKRNCVVKQVFLMRLFSSDFITPLTKQGFIPDIWRLLRMYDLEDILSNYMLTGTFPSTHTWKQLVKSRIREREEHLWHCRLNLDCDLKRFNTLHTALKPNIWWTFSKHFPNQIYACRVVARLCALSPGQRLMTCMVCDVCTPDGACHVLICRSETSKNIRETFWRLVIDRLGVNTYVYLDALEENDLLACLLGMPDILTALLGIDNLVTFMSMVANMFMKICVRSFPEICQTYGF
jgi:hypothetical protein